MLKVEHVESGYGLVQVLWEASLEVKAGSITALLGPNGAGKTTLLRTIFGTLKPLRGQITYESQDVTYLPPHEKVKRGLVLVPEGRRLFGNMTVEENLTMGAYLKAALIQKDESLNMIYSLFPVLKERGKQRAVNLERRRTTDADHSPRPHEQAEINDVGRTQPRPCAEARKRGVQGCGKDEERYELDSSFGRTECRLCLGLV